MAISFTRFNPLRELTANPLHPVSLGLFKPAQGSREAGSGTIRFGQVHFGRIHEDVFSPQGAQYRCYSEFLRQPKLIRVLPEFLAKRFPQGATVHLYGCADGSEPYALAMMFRRLLGGEKARKFRFQASDISEQMVTLARSGRLNLNAEELERYKKYFGRRGFLSPAEPQGLEQNRLLPGAYDVLPVIRDGISFEVADFKDISAKDFPEPAVVVCRNIWNHFSIEDAFVHGRKLFQCLQPGSFVVIGEKDGRSRESLKAAGFVQVSEDSGPYSYMFEKKSV